MFPKLLIIFSLWCICFAPLARITSQMENRSYYIIKKNRNEVIFFIFKKEGYWWVKCFQSFSLNVFCLENTLPKLKISLSRKLSKKIPNVLRVFRNRLALGSISRVFIDVNHIVGETIACQGNSLLWCLISEGVVGIIKLVSLAYEGISGVLGDQERFLCPDQRIDDFSKLLNLRSVRLDHTVSNFLQDCQVLHIHRTDNDPRVVLEKVGSSIPICVEITGVSICKNYFM